MSLYKIKKWSQNRVKKQINCVSIFYLFFQWISKATFQTEPSFCNGFSHISFKFLWLSTLSNIVYLNLFVNIYLMNESINLLELSAYFLKCRTKFEEILELITYSFLIFISLNALLYYFIIHNGKNKFRFFRASRLPTNISRILLVTAHPDDECMFFGPTLIALRERKNCIIYILCLTQGITKIYI